MRGCQKWMPTGKPGRGGSVAAPGVRCIPPSVTNPLRERTTLRQQRTCGSVARSPPCTARDSPSQSAGTDRPLLGNPASRRVSWKPKVHRAAPAASDPSPEDYRYPLQARPPTPDVRAIAANPESAPPGLIASSSDCSVCGAARRTCSCRVRSASRRCSRVQSPVCSELRADGEKPAHARSRRNDVMACGKACGERSRS